MGLVHCASFEAPAWLGTDSLHLQVLSHGRQVVSARIILGGTTVAVYYPPAPVAAEGDAVERLGRQAIGQFQQRLLRQERRAVARRPAHLLDPHARPYEGVLLRLPAGEEQRREDPPAVIPL